MTKSVADEIDWRPFDSDPKCTCHCSCGAVYESHVKYYGRIKHTVTREPCPLCGSHVSTTMCEPDWHYNYMALVTWLLKNAIPLEIDGERCLVLTSDMIEKLSKGDIDE